MPRRYAYLERRDFLAVAHRGGTSHHPENTIEAFQHAVDLGFEYLETDVHASLDGELYAFHDDHLGRVAGVDAHLAELPSADIDAVRFDGYRVPRLDELMTTWPTLMFNIDPKADSSVEPLVRAIRRHGAVDRVCIGSFSDRRIRWCRDELGPALCTSMGPIELLRLWLRSRGLPTGDPEAACVQIPTGIEAGPLRIGFDDDAFIGTAHDFGLEVHVWTIDDTPTMHRLVDLGVDGIMTDRPDVLRSVLLERSRWENTHV